MVMYELADRFGSWNCYGPIDEGKGRQNMKRYSGNHEKRSITEKPENPWIHNDSSMRISLCQVLK